MHNTPGRLGSVNVVAERLSNGVAAAGRVPQGADHVHTMLCLTVCT